jgi:ammonium transporter, Amt family
MFEEKKQTAALLRPKVWALTLLLATLTPAMAFAEGEALSSPTQTCSGL